MVATINEYNAMVDSKKDPLGRTPIMLSHKIVKAPFYAGPIGMCRHHTMGGAKINTKAQVLDRDGNVIPGLYAPVKSQAVSTEATVLAESYCRYLHIRKNRR